MNVLDSLLDHPDITKALVTGYPRNEQEPPPCPICGGKCEFLVLLNGIRVGCNLCHPVETMDIWEAVDRGYFE